MTDMRSGFEVPTDIRRAAEDGIEQAKRAFDEVLNMTQKTAATWEEQSASARAGAKDMSEKAVAFATQNVMTSLDFAQRLVRAKDIQEAFQIQSEFVQTQMRTFGEQAKELGQAAAKASSDMRNTKS